MGDLLVMRLRPRPTEAELADLNAEFADICPRAGIRPTDPLPAEVADDDVLDLPRVALRFDRIHYGRLRQLIDALNALPSAPANHLGRPRPFSVAGTDQTG